jgi:hypothetical protein
MGQEAAKTSKRAALPTPMIQSDIEPYISPLSDPAAGAAGRKIITGRADLREHLKENNCRIVDPSEKADFCGERKVDV